MRNCFLPRPWFFAALVLLAAFALHSPVAAETEKSVHVYVTGSLPGVAPNMVPQVFARALTSAKFPGWVFSPGTGPAEHAPDRMVWTITPLPYAGQSLTRVGRTVAPLQDLFGRYRHVKVEAKLYLGGAFQTMSFSTAQIQGGENDPKIAAIITSVAGPMLTMGLAPEQTPETR